MAERCQLAKPADLGSCLELRINFHSIKWRHKLQEYRYWVSIWYFGHYLDGALTIDLGLKACTVIDVTVCIRLCFKSILAKLIVILLKCSFISVSSNKIYRKKMSSILLKPIWCLNCNFNLKIFIGTNYTILNY